MAMKILKFKFDKYRVSEWLWLAFSYFQAAHCLASNEHAWLRKKLASPTIYNLRHGIELLLKSIMLASGEEVVELTHDNSRLFERARRLLLEADDESVAHAARGLGLSTGDIRTYLLALIWKLEQNCERYAEYTFLPFKVLDPKNELFRYPCSLEGGGEIDLCSDIDILSGIDVVQHADNLSTLSLSFLVMFGKSDSGQHMLEQMAEQEANPVASP